MCQKTFFLLCLSLTAIGFVRSNKPVVIVPGDGGSQLEEKLSRRPTPNVFCRKRTANYIHAWASAHDFEPFYDQCFVANMVLRDVSNGNGSRFANATGVQMRPFEFGSTIGMEYLDPNARQSSSYFAPLVHHLIRKHGYVRGATLFGAPYDFRLAPLDNRFWMAEMRRLIEFAYVRNDRRRVVIVAHSLGNIYTWRFLREMTPQWRRQYVEQYVAISGPWGGSMNAIKAAVTGDNFNQALLNPNTFREALRTWPSLYALFPTADVFDNGTVLLTAQRNDGESVYTLKTLRQLFNDMHGVLG